MIRWLGAVLSLALITLASMQALACPHYEAKIFLTKAREALVTMIDADASKFDSLQADIDKATASVDEALASALSDKTLSADKAKTFSDIKVVWEEFKTTRDTQIIPAVRAGKKDEAKAIATGVQAERFKKMNELLALLGVKS
jgi:Four helix bundle sensory module for signal transduction